MSWIVPFITLTAMEIVLGIDNIVFIAILVGKLPADQQARARSLGLLGALVTRILLLLSISWVMKLTDPVFRLTDLGVPQGWVTTDTGLGKASKPSPPAETAAASAPASTPEATPTSTPADSQEAGHGDMNGISWKDIILLVGGAFLIWHSVKEIHDKIEGHTEITAATPAKASFYSVLVKIALFDIIFSLDSVITAVGMAQHIPVMIASVIAAMLVMIAFAGKVSSFVEQHPTIKVLALSFLILIGVLLVAEGFGTKMNKGYIYFAMAFSLVVEIVNMRVRPTHTPITSDD
ncbi:MAG: TerC family protein [Planctomycetaceae bacterium]